MKFHICLTFLMLIIVGSVINLSAQNKRLGLYIICSKQDSEKDDPFYNRYIGQMVHEHIAKQLKDKKTDVVLMNKIAPKYKVFDKFAKSFYINEAFIDSVGKKQDFYRVMILYFGYSERLGKAEDISVYDKMAFYGVMADPTISSGKNHRNMSFKRYLKGHGYGTGPVSYSNIEYYNDFILSAVNTVKID